MMFAVYVLAGFVIQIVLVHLAFHAIQGGTAAAQAAVLVSAVGFGGLSGRIVGGIASDRLGNRPTMMAAFVLMAVAFALLLLPATWGVLLAFSIIFGVAYGEVLCMMSLLPVDFFGLKNHGTIMGIITAASTIGGGLGPVVAGSLFDATGNYRIAWAVCLGFTVLAFLLVVGLRPQGLSTLKSTGAGSS
jgi:MFS family permease